MIILCALIYLLIAVVLASIAWVALFPKRDRVGVDDVVVISAPVSEPLDGR